MRRANSAVSTGTLMLALCAPVFGQERIDRPEWKQGDAWTLRKTVTSPAGTTTETLVVKVTGDSPASYALSTQRSTRKPDSDTNTTGNDTQDDTSEMRWLRWPLELGKQFKVEGSKEREWSGVVDGWVDVVTPAGKFKAVKVSLTRSGGGRRSASETLWYAPEVKFVVRRESTRPWELQKSGNATSITEVIAYKLN